MQKKILNILTLVALILSLSACIHKVDVEQGNVISQEMINQLHPGMTSDQVQFIMGHPVLVETFENNRADYVYTFQPNGGNITKKRVTLLFNGGVLTSISGTMHPELNPTTASTPSPMSNDAVDPNIHTDTNPPKTAPTEQ
ncbi:MAG: outer rane lipoprotein OmlA [Gammaproteobacteria bacterium]|jgi:outer membrane protein assembly factor BamE|nr:outer rane lipoprotein OmlA [Gammaproteobacteria bacterium]